MSVFWQMLIIACPVCKLISMVVMLPLNILSIWIHDFYRNKDYCLLRPFPPKLAYQFSEFVKICCQWYQLEVLVTSTNYCGGFVQGVKSILASFTKTSFFSYCWLQSFGSSFEMACNDLKFCVYCRFAPV